LQAARRSKQGSDRDNTITSGIIPVAEGTVGNGDLGVDPKGYYQQKKKQSFFHGVLFNIY
jgi:hypothetical protein